MRYSVRYVKNTLRKAVIVQYPSFTNVRRTSSLLNTSNEEHRKYMVQQGSTKKRNRFADLFRHSKLVQLGDFEGRIVIGEIVRRVADDLYIDFGLKFQAVCKVPPVGGERYVIGENVLLRLHDPELSELFLGSTKELTLLEADATLLGLYRPRSEILKNKEFLSALRREVHSHAKTEDEKGTDNISTTN